METTMATKRVYRGTLSADGALEAITLDTTQSTRRCKGSERFGIEAHDAPIADFPAQPSRPGGLGVMCAVHWRAYVKALTADRKARANVAPIEAAMEAIVDASLAADDEPEEVKARPSRRAAKAPDPAVVAAEAIIAEVDALPGPEATKRNGDPDVQAALETAAKASVGAEHEA